MVTDDDKLYLWPYDRNHEDISPKEIEEVDLSEYDFVGSLKKGKNQFILAKVNRLLEKLQASNTFFFDVSRNVTVREIDTVQDKLIRYLTQKNIPIIFSAVNTFFKKQKLTIQSDLNTLHTSLYNRSDDDEKKLFSTFGKIV